MIRSSYKIDMAKSKVRQCLGFNLPVFNACFEILQQEKVMEMPKFERKKKPNFNKFLWSL